MCGDRAGQDFWQEVAGSGSEGGACTGSRPPRPSEITLLAQAEEFISVPEGPRARLGPARGGRQQGVGLAVTFDFRL